MLTTLKDLVANTLANELAIIPDRLVSAVDTQLTQSQEQDVVGTSVDQFIQQISEESVPLDEAHESELITLATKSIGVALQDDAIIVLADDVKELLADEMVDAFIQLDSATSEAIEMDGEAMISEEDKESVASEVARHLSDALEVSVDQIVKSDIDPNEETVVESIVASKAEEAVGASIAEILELEIARLLLDRTASLQAAQAEGSGTLSPLRNALGVTVGRLAITAAVPWVLFTFLWKAWGDWEQRRYRRNEQVGQS